MKKIVTLCTVALISNGVFSQSGSQAFDTSGIFIVPAGVTNITIEVVGGGGSGGGNGTGGGGGGGYAMGTYTVTPSDTIPVTVGAAGGTTSVGTLISATGGGQGVFVSNPQVGGGGAGGIGSGGTINHTGGVGGGGFYTYFGGGGGGAAGPTGNGLNGGNSITWTGVCQFPGGTGGVSGGAPGGKGGKGAGFTDASCNVTNPAAAGLNYGGGGGGGNGNGGGPGTGAPGYCMIRWGSTTGVSDLNFNENLFVMKNPFTITIKLQNTIGNENYELFNTFGQMIWSGKNIEEQDFSALGIGMYFLKVRNENSSRTFKLLKQAI